MEKKETLGGGEINLYKGINEIIDGGKDLIKGFEVSRCQAIDYAFQIALKTAEWQEQKMYSEEDMRKMYNVSCDLIGLGKLDDQTENNERFEELFKQFKK